MPVAAVTGDAYAGREALGGLPHLPGNHGLGADAHHHRCGQALVLEAGGQFEQHRQVWGFVDALVGRQLDDGQASVEDEPIGAELTGDGPRLGAVHRQARWTAARGWAAWCAAVGDEPWSVVTADGDGDGDWAVSNAAEK